MTRLRDKVKFKINDVTTWLTNNYNTHIIEYLIKLKQSGNKIWLVIEYIISETFFLKNHKQNVMEKLFPDLFLKNQNVYL